MEIKPVVSDSRLTVLVARHYAQLFDAGPAEGSSDDAAMAVAFHYVREIHRTKSNRAAYVRVRPR